VVQAEDLLEPLLETRQEGWGLQAKGMMAVMARTRRSEIVVVNMLAVVVVVLVLWGNMLNQAKVEMVAPAAPIIQHGQLQQGKGMEAYSLAVVVLADIIQIPLTV
tara:strand:+ start:302 stop:616 length:315 start_codon:yes stop_codon:yes gene_type:complete